MNLEDIRSFRRTLRRFERVTASQLKSCCARVTLAQCLVLMEIEEAAELTMGELATRLRLDSSTLTRTVDGLVRDGLAERTRVARDRRVVRIRLARRGEAVCRSIHAENDDHARRVFARIPASRRATVIRSFELLVQAFLEEEAGGAATEPSGKPRSGGKEAAS
jgi:DNA-binding MarR family transcriptional regulator